MRSLGNFKVVAAFAFERAFVVGAAILISDLGRVVFFKLSFSSFFSSARDFRGRPGAKDCERSAEEDFEWLDGEVDEFIILFQCTTRVKKGQKINIKLPGILTYPLSIL